MKVKKKYFETPPDTTTCGYNPDGTLAVKTCADNFQVIYTYAPDGKLATRTWGWEVAKR